MHDLNRIVLGSLWWPKVLPRIMLTCGLSSGVELCNPRLLGAIHNAIVTVLLVIDWCSLHCCALRLVSPRRVQSRLG